MGDEWVLKSAEITLNSLHIEKETEVNMEKIEKRLEKQGTEFCKSNSFADVASFFDGRTFLELSIIDNI